MVARLSAIAARSEAFRQGLRELGYVEGKNIVIEWRSAEGKLDRLPGACCRASASQGDVIVTAGPLVTRAAKEATVYDSHCHGAGYRSCWQRVRRQPCATWREHHWTVHPCPGAKRKTNGAFEGDRSQALRVAVFGTSTRPGNAQALREVELAAGAFGVKLQYLDILSPKDIETAFRAAVKERADGSHSGCVTGSIGNPHRKQIADLAVKSRLPVIYLQRAVCGSRGAYVLRRERYRLGPARRHLCGQNSQRCQARRSAGRAADEVRVHHQSESGEADRSDDSAECAGASGQGDQVSVRRKVYVLVFAGLLSALLQPGRSSPRVFFV